MCAVVSALCIPADMSLGKSAKDFQHGRQRLGSQQQKEQRIRIGSMVSSLPDCHRATIERESTKKTDPGSAIMLQTGTKDSETSKL